MPEGLEAEIWRRALDDLLGRRIDSVWIDRRVADPDLLDVLPGSSIDCIGRHGKIVTIECGDHHLGLHFGMTGRLVIDGDAPIERLEYASARDDPDWDRLRLWTAGARKAAIPAIRMNDPRRLGRITLDADLSRLGPDVFSIDRPTLGIALDRRSAMIKPLLLDQSVVAGLGNLCADEVLWWAGIAPTRPARSLTSAEIATLAITIRRRLPIMLRRGGSTAGVLHPALRAAVGLCPRDGEPLTRRSIAGRTAVWCAFHQT